ncbi:MAG: hypothetical protein K1X53_14655 [Candidatus Sumerlaeaceae bacterium]|nr:hypothetical protein [Candidatus Sumerlaeaceae bacterium]
MYDLCAIEETSLLLGLSCNRVDEYEIEVLIAPDTPLVFANTENGTDTYLGFNDVPWHTHGTLLLETGDSTFAEFGPEELLAALISGEVLIVAQYFGDELKDRWLVHRNDNSEFRYMEPGEELRIYRIGT